MTEKKLWLLFAGVIFCVFLYKISSILTPFLTGIIFAYSLNPLVEKFEGVGLGRSLASSLVTVLFVTVVIFLILLIYPTFQEEFLKLVVKVPDYISIIQQHVTTYSSKLAQKLSPEDLQKIQQTAVGYVGDLLLWGANLLQRVLTSGLALASVFSFLVITPIVTFYCLNDWDKILRNVKKLFPKKHTSTINKQIGLMDRTLRGFARGQATVCFVLVFYYSLALKFVGLDSAIAIGTTTGILAFIPYVGAFIGFMMCLLVAIGQFADWHSIFMVMIVFGAGQFIEGKFLTPNLVGDRIGLHPVWVIFSLFAGGSLFGFVGILIAVPVAGVIGVLVRFSVDYYLHSPWYLGKRKRR